MQAMAQDKGKPEKSELKVGFIPITCATPLIMADPLGFYKKEGLNVQLNKTAGWALIRDKMINKEHDASHFLSPMPLAMSMGLGSNQVAMNVASIQNTNGQAITLSKKLADKGALDGASLAKLMAAEKREYTYAQTFPTGTHAMWLYYWLASIGVNPFKDVKTIVVPPPQMVANMRIGNMDGYCVGEPWNARAVADKIGFTVATSQDIWAGHPEKVLGATADFVKQYPNTARAMVAAILEASRYIDAKANRASVAKLIADKAYVNAPEDVIVQRFMGNYDNGNGKRWQDPNLMKFYDEGAREGGFEAGIQAESFHPDAIIVDYSIGHAEALQICQNLRRNTEYSETILIALLPDDGNTAGIDRSTINETFKKPFDAKLLAERLRTLIGGRKELV